VTAQTYSGWSEVLAELDSRILEAIRAYRTAAAEAAAQRRADHEPARDTAAETAMVHRYRVALGPLGAEIATAILKLAGAGRPVEPAETTPPSGSRRLL
jgi:hypothetical protein